MNTRVFEFWDMAGGSPERERFRGRFGGREGHCGCVEARENSEGCASGEHGEFTGEHDQHGGRHCGAGRGQRFFAGSRRGFGGGHEGHGRHGWRQGFGGRGPGDFGGFAGRFGGRERMFDAGDLKLVVLKLLAEQPSYGYQLIKTMEERLAGGYTPSAGAIYPTLTMLEEEGLAASVEENNKKVYSVTPEGQKYLDANKRRVEEIFSRLEEAGQHFERGRSPEIMKAFLNLRGAVIARVSRGKVTKEQIHKIAEAIDAAAKAVDDM